MSQEPTTVGNWKDALGSDARAYYDKVFSPTYQGWVRRVNKTPLTILVWGPGQNGGELYAKRVQIRDELRREGHAAVFSEEVDQDLPVADLSAKARELLQALSADFIVVIDGSYGANSEVHDFGGFYQEIGSKMLIFVDSVTKEGYSYKGLLSILSDLYGNVETYEYPKDIHECHLLGKVRTKVKVLRWAKFESALRQSDERE